VEVRRRWPEGDFDRDEFENYAIDRAPTARSEFASWHPVDLALCAAVVARHPEAMRIFEREFIAPLVRPLARFRSDALSEEALQTVRQKLLVDGSARIESYTGKGPLSKWVEVVAVRTAVSLRRKDREVPVGEDVLMHLVDRSGIDPALAHLKQTYRAQFDRAWRAALRALEPRDRTVLRLKVQDGLPAARIAALHGVHETTAARWLRDIRETLRATVRADLTAQLAVTDSELDSIFRLIHSQIDATLGEISSDSEGL